MPSRPSLKKVRTPLLLAFMMAFAALPTLGNSQEADKKVFQFNVSPNGYPPYLIVDGKEPAGIMWDVVSLIVPRLGYQVEPRQVPRKRVDRMVTEGYLDATPRAIEWTRHPEHYLFTDPIVHVEEVFFFPKSSKLQFETLEDLTGKTIVTPLGYVYPKLEPYFKSGKIKRFEVSNERNMFHHLRYGDEFDAALADRLVGHWLLREEGLKGYFRLSDNTLSRYGFRLMLRPDWKDFAEAFNRELAKIRENGELDAILARYR
ncbi:substrate-binding periplasmic protein [Marinobacter persicus]|jgi:polar amino acid transport system substrate-binding protein|uniref:Amino acid ABC transporter substrate-binding protein (PAAT family) n=1 Tax=Marinobacter persicus TaxID=930118 RepID=A0A2S6G7N9_9GAMM|nr:transporter substrate-binding domain-containing protein [Marinobacter persicus]PPK52110.1 amino acid ABC transporter substrate-binding protein (PAAT family) [Marinobacter persicus]PPK55202.1 amino acid ABC transporter substrate-binding protein (PAAT family) [Marinobacter persicus]PPK58870.1 amino acid ABC transporter substrate-binding protein (PAAT family) [Marinobacter persicus]